MESGDVQFIRSSYCLSTSSNCVEIARGIRSNLTYIRNLKNHATNVLTFTREEWELFLRGVKDGQFDFPEG
jgi:hypothetical protein